MTTTKNSLVLAVAFALSSIAAGCGGDYSNMPGGDDGNGMGGGGSGGSRPLDATGTYAIHSTFDIATNMPGTAGTVVNTFIAATDDPDDPTKWILDQIIAQVSNSEVKSALTDGEGLVVGLLNDQLESLGPTGSVITAVKTTGQDFGDIAKQFGLNETLQLAKSGDGYVAVHTVTGVHFKIGTVDGDYAFANYGLPDVTVDNVAVSMDPTGQMTIAAHDVPLAYGQVLRMGLDAGIIPLIDPSAHDLGDLLAHKIDCKAIGSVVADFVASKIGFSLISASEVTNVCTAGLSAAAALVYSQIDKIDGSALQFGINGTARGVDRDGDRMIDTIQTGTWSGTLSYGNTPSPLAPATFFGQRM